MIQTAGLELLRPPTFSGGRASQILQEITAFVLLLKDAGVTSYLEVGARHGDTFHWVMTHLPPGSRGVAVDMPGGKWGRRNTGKYLRKAVADLNRRGYRCKIVLGDSGAAATLRAVKVIAMTFDACLIDGDHRYAGVRRDWELYGPLANLVAFHDIAGDGQGLRDGTPVEVPRLWREIRDDQSIELVADGSPMGIGVTRGPQVRSTQFAAQLGVQANPKLILPQESPC